MLGRFLDSCLCNGSSMGCGRERLPYMGQFRTVQLALLAQFGGFNLCALCTLC
jgi:hypothetical protein